ncbi:MAG: zinc ribbon domain-containing protein [Thermodesulfobacteriota bacterium]
MSKKCPKCGRKVENDWAVCPSCATSMQSTVCGQCGKEMEPEWVACPVCGWRDDSSDIPELPDDDVPDDVPDLPDDDVFEKAKEATPEQKRRAQRLLDEFRQAIDDYERELRPQFGKGFAMLFGMAKPADPELCFSLRNQIYEAVEDRDATYAGPFWDMLCNRDKKDLDIVATLRREVQYIKRELGLSSGSGIQKDEEADKFICPGCGERATAKDGSRCPTCNQFVHEECRKTDGWGHWNCPVCRSALED